MRASMLCTAFVALATSLASAQPTTAPSNPLIARGQTEVDELRYEEALQTLSAALVRAGNTPDELRAIYRLLAFTYLALGREEEASGAYRSLLPLAPDDAPSAALAPRFREFFARVRAQWEAEGRPGSAPPPPVTIRHRSPPRGERGQPIALTAEIEDPASRVAQVVLAYRRGADDAVFRRVDAQLRDGAFVATIAGADVTPPLVEYYFEALDAQGLPIAARGDVAAPLRIAVPAPEAGGDVLTEWWFWTIVGVVAVGAVVGVVTGVVIGSQSQSGTLIITVD